MRSRSVKTEALRLKFILELNKSFKKKKNYLAVCNAPISVKVHLIYQVLGVGVSHVEAVAVYKSAEFVLADKPIVVKVTGQEG
jgi:hypothetical protein